MTGSISGDCVGSGSETGAMTIVESNEILDAAGNIKVRPLSLSVNASFPFQQTCSSRVENPDQSYSIEKTTSPVSAMLDLSFCDVSSGKGTYTCADFGSQWNIQFTRE